ncbi:hypothetical protein KJ612_06310 [Myxococcota bacterium]|nr:hypothetical protein [Myxococcota bacterium]MBU1410775.1 hypothetical protein [Myxococcota bacterium]
MKRLMAILLFPAVLLACASGSGKKTTDCDEGLGLGTDGRCHVVCEDVDDCGDCQACTGDLCYDLSPCPDLCGNGDVDEGEGCDDGNTVTEGCAVGETTCTVCDATCQWRDIDLTACGDGETTGTEECDDGGTAPADGCSASCLVEADWSCDATQTPSVCIPIPDPPVIEGEASAGHDDLYWRWSTPEGAVSFLARVNSGAESETAAAETTHTAANEGLYTLEVRACNVQGGCSAPASFGTQLVYHGAAWRPVWRGVAKADLTANALGEAVPVSCHNCYNGPADEVYTTAEALTKIRLAISRRADLIELDLADALGTLCVNHGDLDDCTGHPTLVSLLDDPTFADADAMLFMEIKEGTADPDAFAVALLDILDARRKFVRNGRPVFIRSFAALSRYLEAIKARLPEYPFIKDYFRFSVLYSRNAIAEVAAFHTELARVRDTLGYDMVEFEYRQKNLPGLTMYARSLDLGTGVYTIPGSFGEAFIAALRHEVDQITAEFRADYARAVISETNLLAYVNAAGCTSAADSTVAVLRNNTGTAQSTPVTVGVAPTASAFGTPPLWYDGPGEDRFGCSMDFRSSQGITGRALPLGATSSQNTQGFFVTAYVNFDALSLTGTHAIVNNAEAGGFALELYGDGATTVLRFGVNIGGTYRYQSYNVAATGLPGNAALNGTDGYYLFGAYDGDGGVYLWIDQEALGSGGTFTGNVTTSSQPALAGADPQPSEPTDARFFFDGLIQQVSVLDWINHSFPAPIVN